MRPKVIVGIDVGGTNIKFGLVDSAGKIFARTHLATNSFVRRRKTLIDALVEKIKELLKGDGLIRKDIAGIGFGLPGLIQPEQGIVNFLPNIPGWKNVPLKRLLEQRLKIPVFLENDVNLIALGEWHFGAGRGYKNLVCITLGTGVGGGLILNNALYRGEGFAAGEVGHMPLNEDGPACPCGGRGCFERYVGNRTILARARELFQNETLALQEIYPYAVKGDKRALLFWREVATSIGNGLVGVVNLLNPRLIIIGGGVSNNYRFMRQTIKSIIKKRCMSVQGRMAEITRAQLGDDAGIIGARVLVEESGKRRKN